MIAYFEGNVYSVDQSGTSCVVLVSGVGYKVSITPSLCSRLPKIGDAVQLHISSIFRNERLDLFGFDSELDCKVFESIIEISGLGPAKAIAILDKFSVAQLAKISDTDDSDSLSTVSGISANFAKKLILELKSKLKKLKLAVAIDDDFATDTQVIQDTLSALINLGYGMVEARKGIREAIATGHTDAEQIIRYVLTAKGSNK